MQLITKIVFLVLIISGMGCFGAPKLIHSTPTSNDFRYFNSIPHIDSSSNLKTNGFYHYDYINEAGVNSIGIIWFESNGKIFYLKGLALDSKNHEISKMIRDKNSFYYRNAAYGYFVSKGNKLFLEYVKEETMVAYNAWYLAEGVISNNGLNIIINRIIEKDKKDYFPNFKCNFSSFKDD